MKNKKNKNFDTADSQLHHIPDLDIIDLENEDGCEPQEPAPSPDSPEKKKFRLRVNVHIILLVVFIVFVAGIIYRLKNWGVEVDLDEIFKDGPGEYEFSFDEMFPVFNSEGEMVYQKYDENSTILLFGNAPFADDRNSDDNLANMIQEMTGATVYNCAVNGSYLATLSTSLDTVNAPMDIFNFYWLCALALGDTMNEHYQEGLATLGEDAPPEATYVYNTLKGIDMASVDVIGIMYDGSDYLAGHPMYDDAYDENITQFTGNMLAGIRLIQSIYPHIRFIVMSPTYAFAIDENGEYVSSDIQRYGYDVLSTYMIKQHDYCLDAQVTFVDNLYVTVNEDTAPDYLTDNLHLNVAGRKKVAERFVYALNYYNKKAK